MSTNKRPAGSSKKIEQYVIEVKPVGAPDSAWKRSYRYRPMSLSEANEVVRDEGFDCSVLDFRAVKLTLPGTIYRGRAIVADRNGE